MRRIAHMFLAVCLLCGLLAGTACAAGRTYYLEEAGFSVTVPDSLAAFTRDYSPDDPEFKEFGLTEEIMQSIFYDANNYLLAIDRRLGHEVLISIIENGVGQEDFENVGSEEIDALVAGYEAMGFDVLEEPRVYPHGPVNFVVIKYKIYVQEIPLYCLSYVSGYEGKSIGLTLRSYLGLITEEQEALMQTMVDSVVFDAPGQSAAPSAPAEVPEQSTAPSAPAEVPEQSAAPSAPAEAPQRISVGKLVGYFLLTVLITVLVYDLPLAIYRYAIRKRPVPRKTAKIITVVYAFAFLFLASVVLARVITVGAAILTILGWSFVNYRMLVKGDAAAAEQAVNDIE